MSDFQFCVARIGIVCTANARAMRTGFFHVIFSGLWIQPSAIYSVVVQLARSLEISVSVIGAGGLVSTPFPPPPPPPPPIPLPLLKTSFPPFLKVIYKYPPKKIFFLLQAYLVENAFTKLSAIYFCNLRDPYFCGVCLTPPKMAVISRTHNGKS